MKINFLIGTFSLSLKILSHDFRNIYSKTFNSLRSWIIYHNYFSINIRPLRGLYFNFRIIPGTKELIDLSLPFRGKGGFRILALSSNSFSQREGAVLYYGSRLFDLPLRL